MKDQILEIIKKVTGYDEIDEKIDLIEEDILDSLAFIELMEELNDKFNIDIQPTQVPSNTWRKIDNIVELVKKLEAKKNN